MQTNIIIAILSALTLSASAAPIAERSSSFQCSPYDGGRSIKLYNVTQPLYDLAFDPNDKKDGHAKLKAVDSTSHKFQFFHCQAPSDKYFSQQRQDDTEYLALFGQLRSVTHPDMCATSGHVIVESTKSEYPPNSDGTITLQPCATEDSLQLRLQWFGIDPTPESHPPPLWVKGLKTDVSLTAFLVGDDSSVSPTTYGPQKKKYGLFYVS